MNALLWVHAQSNVANLIQCDKSAFVFNRKHKIYYNNKFCYSKTSGEDLKSLETISSQIEYDQIAEETLQSIGDHVEEILASSDLQDWDVTYNNGVLTISLNDHGTYVINKQSPNKQIWLSSPFSGPKKYDFNNGIWIYKQDGISLHELLNNEIPKVIKKRS
ncbi:frataxin homolog, mitochondrial [Caerostris extrusa]|uniref:ferroxidase n=1 Tax=Caerostris extrusa TaxID=172846 RepID=A0AAV4NT17_CAEEX|nr:frataxin homolog, mitochondrial [Caerostris extrusa]